MRYFYFYVPPVRKLVFTLQLRVALCCILRYSEAQSSSHPSSWYSVGTILTKPCTFELRMRLLQYAATTTQDRENQNVRN